MWNDIIKGSSEHWDEPQHWELCLCGWENVMLEPKSEGLNKNIKMGFPKGLGVIWTLPGVDKHLQLQK